MPYTPDNIMQSESAYELCRLLTISDESLYPAKMSEKTGIAEGSVRNMLRTLREKPLQFIERGERDHQRNIQYYEMNTDALYRYWHNELEKRIDTAITEMKQNEVPADRPVEEVMAPVIEEWERKKETLNAEETTETLNIFLTFWIGKYMEKEPESTLEQMLFDDLEQALRQAQQTYETSVWKTVEKLGENAGIQAEELQSFPEELEPVLDALAYQTDHTEHFETILTYPLHKAFFDGDLSHEDLKQLQLFITGAAGTITHETL